MNNIIGCALGLLATGYWIWLMCGCQNPFKRNSPETSDKWVQLNSMLDRDYSS